MNEVVIREFGFVEMLKIAQRVFDKYKEDQPKWWKCMDGTPILNDVSARMAEAFVIAFRCEAFCGVHAELDKSGKLEPFANCLACIRAENLELQSETARLRAEREQLQVQLAGCGVAALGGTNPASTATKEMYGWSPAYQDTLDLRLKYDTLTAERDGLRDALLRLTKEISGVLSYAGDEIEAAAGVTNTAVLTRKIEEAERVLAALPGKETK